MEHEVFVPVPEEPLREALADPERVAGAVPGWQRAADADSPPLSGRLRARVGGHTITYRGALRLAPRAGGDYSLDGEGVEVRGGGSVKFSLILRLAPAAEGGTSLTFTGTGSGDGRVAEIAESSPQAVEAAVRRLLARFGEGLGAGASPAPGDAADSADATDAADPVDAAEGSGGEPRAESSGGASDDASGDVPDDVSAAAPDSPDGPGDSVPGLGGIYEAEVPPPSLDPLADDFDRASDLGGGAAAEAAHARRTMIGRSAEEVDHAPPRGRYAPVPAPEAMSGGVATLRWAAPAAAVVVASAILVGRVLRRRR
ncbi:SRPBCC domain-containing protein [Streptomyces flavofungini]|uniref:SRPBCC domain-containing protein n=1 Tax=Streptomyces flavofungini TaxID=68200 RepID=UPI0025AFC741|nr:SRPBCC domain-containing protein [Streptomyces flavofungini]WJV47287.1 SRPBCC domain-containing protein [Streptomyces flavofungini]